MTQGKVLVSPFRKVQHCSSCGTELEPFEFRHGVCVICFTHGTVSLAADYQEEEVTPDLVQEMEAR